MKAAKIMRILGLVLGIITIIFGFVSGGYDWGYIGIAAGLGISLTSLSGILSAKKE